MRGIPGDEHAPHLVPVGDRYAQVPEPDMVERAGEREARDFLDQTVEIEIVLGGVGGDRRMEEPPLSHVDAAEELPIAPEVRMHHPIGGARGEAFETLVKLARTKHHEHHELVEIRPAACDADLVAHDGAGAVAAHDIVCLQDIRPDAGFLDDRNPYPVAVLRDRARGPPEPALDVRKLRDFVPQHAFHPVLGQPLIGLKVIGTNQLPAGRGVPVFARQAAEGGDLADRIAGRHHSGGAQFVDEAPEVKMLEGAVGEVLPLGNIRQAGATFHQRAGHASQSEVYGERSAHRPCAYDDDLVTLAQSPILFFGAIRPTAFRSHEIVIARPVPSSSPRMTSAGASSLVDRFHAADQIAQRRI